MPYKFPSNEWLQALKDKLNNDAKYARTARNWEGDIVFQIEPGGPLKETMYFFTNLYHGSCPKAFIVDSEAEIDALKPAYILAAPYENFIRILQGDLDPMQAMITRKLRVHGSMAYMMRNVPTVLDFVRCAKEIETEE